MNQQRLGKKRMTEVLNVSPRKKKATNVVPSVKTMAKTNVFHGTNVSIRDLGQLEANSLVL